MVLKIVVLGEKMGIVNSPFYLSSCTTSLSLTFANFKVILLVIYLFILLWEINLQTNNKNLMERNLLVR